MRAHKQQSYIIGIDEVGRGPLAGPVVVCAVAIPRLHRYARRQDCCQAVGLAKHCGQARAFRSTTLTTKTPLRDSKKLTAPQRAIWATALKTNLHIRHSITSVSPLVIDRINVTRSANRAATRALTKVLATLPALSRVEVFLDGGLFVAQNSNFEFLISKNSTKQKYQSRFHNSKNGTSINLKIETVIKGDEKIPAISFASIIAKQHRDALMHRAHKKYPLYGFDRHVGYGTRKHILAIKEHGRSPLHRKSFLKRIV